MYGVKSRAVSAPVRADGKCSLYQGKKGGKTAINNKTWSEKQCHPAMGNAKSASMFRQVMCERRAASTSKDTCFDVTPSSCAVKPLAIAKVQKAGGNWETTEAGQSKNSVHFMGRKSVGPECDTDPRPRKAC